jgi:sialate O-acetylesterase
LQQALNQPIGLIEPSWGGTRAEAWMPRPTFDALKLPYEPKWTQRWLNPPPNDKPRPYEAPGVLYNGMIHPIAGYALRGVIWYQGETNTAYGEHYRDVLTALITSWRAAWNQGDFPFLVVQLANLENSRFWPTLRAGQAQVARELPNVGLTVTIDVGEPKDIHPKDKQTVGHRLAVAARKIAYGQDVPHAGPTFKSMRVDGNSAVIDFDHVYDGLKSKGDAVQGFEIAGADGRFVPATATIDGPRVRVRAESVTSPTSVRYGWANNPTCTLYNAADLPAAPFEATAATRAE